MGNQYIEESKKRMLQESLSFNSGLGFITIGTLYDKGCKTFGDLLSLTEVELHKILELNKEGYKKASNLRWDAQKVFGDPVYLGYLMAIRDSEWDLNDLKEETEDLIKLFRFVVKTFEETEGLFQKD